MGKGGKLDTSLLSDEGNFQFKLPSIPPRAHRPFIMPGRQVLHNDGLDTEDEPLVPSFRQSPSVSCYKKQPGEKCRGYAYTALICFCFIAFVFFIKIVDCSHEDCFESSEGWDNWTLQCLLGLLGMALFTGVLGILCLVSAKCRELRLSTQKKGYEEI